MSKIPNTPEATLGHNRIVIASPALMQFLVEHLSEPHAFAAQAVLSELGTPMDASPVSLDGTITVYFAANSRGVPVNHSALLPHTWRFDSFETAMGFREFIKRTNTAAVTV